MSRRVCSEENATVRVTVAKREKFKRLNKLKKKKKSLIHVSRAPSSAAVAPVRLADILGDVGDVEYNKGSWRSKMERKNCLKSGVEVRTVQTQLNNDEEISVLSKASRGSKDSYPRIHADASIDCDRHKGYIIHPSHRSSVEDDSFCNDSETTSLFGKHIKNKFEDERQDISTREGKFENYRSCRSLLPR